MEGTSEKLTAFESQRPSPKQSRRDPSNDEEPWAESAKTKITTANGEI